MSRELGTLKLPNGGALEVTAFAGPGRGRRVQFTLTQGEGGITAYGNTDADGVAELTGWLETWLLEQGRRSVPNEVPGPMDYREQTHYQGIGLEQLRAKWGGRMVRLEVWRGETTGAGITLPYGAASVLYQDIGRNLLAPAGVEELERRAEGENSPDPIRGADTAGRASSESATGASSRQVVSTTDRPGATPASDSLEALDVMTSLEDYGAIGEEALGFASALEARRRGEEPGAGVYSFGGVERAASEARRALEELVKYCGALEHKRPADLTELGPVTHYAARFLEAKLTLGEVLDAAVRQGGETLTSR